MPMSLREAFAPLDPWCLMPLFTQRLRFLSGLLRFRLTCTLIWLQAEAPEEDMDVRGGGAAAEDARIVKAGYESDDEAEEKLWPGHHTSAAPMHLVSCPRTRCWRKQLRKLGCCCYNC